MKKVISVLLLIVMVFALFTGCSANSDIKNSTDDNTNQSPSDDTTKEKIVMYTNAEFAPFEYFEGQNIVGVDIDIANEIANSLGKELVVEHLDFDSLLPAIITGKADFVAAGMTITPERQEEVDFSIPYVDSVQNIIYKKEAELKNMEDLKGKVIGVQLGTTGDLAISDAINTEGGELNGSGAEVKMYSNALEASQDLMAGRLDAVIIDKLPAEEIVKNNSDKLGTDNFGEIGEYYGIAVKKGNTELLKAINSTLEKLLEENKVEEFIDKHTK